MYYFNYINLFSPNIVNRSGQTPLHVAALYDRKVFNGELLIFLRGFTYIGSKTEFRKIIYI